MYICFNDKLKKKDTLRFLIPALFFSTQRLRFQLIHRGMRFGNPDGKTTDGEIAPSLLFSIAF